jgi:hypothetical protein
MSSNIVFNLKKQSNVYINIRYFLKIYEFFNCSTFVLFIPDNNLFLKRINYLRMKVLFKFGINSHKVIFLTGLYTCFFFNDKNIIFDDKDLIFPEGLILYNNYFLNFSFDQIVELIKNSNNNNINLNIIGFQYMIIYIINNICNNIYFLIFNMQLVFRK